MAQTRVDRVIVGVSGSLGNLAAVRTAIDEARLHNAPLLAIRTWPPASGELAYRRSLGEPDRVPLPLP